MPISPYSGQIYSGYAIGRPYTGASSLSNYSTTSSGFKLSGSNSSYALRGKLDPRPTFLTGNTAALKKTFSDAAVAGLPGNSSVSFHDNVSSLRKYNGILPNTNNREGNNESNRGFVSRTKLLDIKEDEKSKYESKPYVSKYRTYFYSKEDSSPNKPKEIDTSNINVTSKYPTFSNTSGNIADRDGNESISRNRQVVRLTINREKDQERKALVLPENSVKTIAQKLFEKYTVSDPKTETSLLNYPKGKQVSSVIPPKLEPPKVARKPPKLPQSKVSTVKGISKTNFKFGGDGNDGDDECSEDESETRKSEKDGVANCFIRATRAACSNKELEYPEDVKDAIVAAILHPGIDIESDEEIKQLVEADTEEGGSTKKKRKSKESKKADSITHDKRKLSNTEIGGEMIVDKLKRFVKQQVSIKKESIKNNSKKSSLNSLSNKCSNSNLTDMKPKERIIPIILQDENYSYFAEGETEKNKTNFMGNLIPITYENTSDISPLMSLHLNEQTATPKYNGENLTKHFDSVYQSKVGEASSALSKSFQTPFEVSREPSITHPENKVSPTFFFITESLPPWRRSEKSSSFEFLDSNGMRMLDEEAKEERKLKEKDALKGAIKNKELIIKDYDSKVGKRQAKNSDEFQSELDNSITKKSPGLIKKEKEIIFDSGEKKSNYCLNKEGTSRDFHEAKIESRKEYLEGPLTTFQFELDSKETEKEVEESRVSEIKDKIENTFENKFDQGEIRDYQGEKRHYILDERVSINSDYKVKVDKNKTKIAVNNVNNSKNMELNLDESSVPKQALAKSKKTFLKSLAAENSEREQPKLSATKKLDLKKSATTQIIKEQKDSVVVKMTSLDAESAHLGVPDLEMKPSLKKFLEFAKSDLQELDEYEDKTDYSVNINTKDVTNITKKDSPTIHKKDNVAVDKNDSVNTNKQEINVFCDANKQTANAAQKKGQLSSKSDIKNEPKTPKIQPKRPRFIPPLSNENSVAKEILNARNILKRPSKTKVSFFNQKEKITIAPEIKPKKVWQKPLPSKETNSSGQELLSPEIQLKKKISQVKAKEETEKIQEISSENLEFKEQQKIGNSVEKARHVELKANENKPNGGTELLKTSKMDNKITPTKSNSKFIIQPNEPVTSKEHLSLEKKQAFHETPNCLVAGTAKNVISEALAQNNCEPDEKCALSTSQSADSAYGSSPSTPQPRGRNLRDENGISEEKSELAQQKPEEIENKLYETSEESLCDSCGTNCHKKCEKQMANLCGVNQKLLAEALSSVKKGSSSDGKDAFRILPTASASASKSASSVSSAEGESTTTTTTEDEETETDTDSSEYNGPAEIRSPIQTRPKYRKYNIEDFNFIKVLGKGSFGKVMLAQQVNTENYFAVKCLKKDVVLEDNDVECCLIERKVLTLGTKHPYLCHLFCSFQTPSHLFFVMEYLTGGDLMFHIQRIGRFDEYRSCFYAAEITSGLKFLHSKGIIYRDLKLDNILLDFEGHIRIADFGMCKLQIYLDRFADTFCGTPDYMAPEVIKGLHYNQCVDWWSFGVLLYEMMIGKSPFKGCDEDHLFWLICNEEPFYPRFLSREAQSLLKMLLDKDATRRIGPPYSPHGDLKCHNFFKYVDWNKIERKEVETPYKPRLRHILDVQYFDRSFTKRNAAITPLDDSILESMDQTPFKDFSYTNPNITD